MKVEKYQIQAEFLYLFMLRLGKRSLKDFIIIFSEWSIIMMEYPRSSQTICLKVICLVLAVELALLSIIITCNHHCFALALALISILKTHNYHWLALALASIRMT